ncbi:MAG: 4-hydroxy-3-methylbut-2-enyl diphosphate reductase [Verrucomicrobiae bacterium]|nr:4-hydroxy-3-methylbut-2-enyl diphosphate reductase [Verrucomicrobiae bacterium]
MTAPSQRINLRTPEVMLEVQAKVEQHYQSSLVEKIRAEGGVFEVEKTHFYLAKQFGFCYGVERAIDLAYAARKVFPEARLFLVGEIIHNPEVNAQMAALGIQNLFDREHPISLDSLQPEDVVILPAFGAETSMIEKIKERGCRVVDTTCGDVMSVWKRVRQNAAEQVTSIIHGKAAHEETRATASRALGKGEGHYLIVFNLEEADAVCNYIIHGGDRAADFFRNSTADANCGVAPMLASSSINDTRSRCASEAPGTSSPAASLERSLFLKKFEGAVSAGFDPDLHLQRIGVANQTTMLRGETEEVQRRLRAAIEKRDASEANFRFFDTICGATQERQDALMVLLERPLDFLLVIGGYNSSNTTHLAEIGEKKLPTYFIRNQECLESEMRLRHFDLHQQREIVTEKMWMNKPLGEPLSVGITAGASCPNSLIEEVIKRVLELRQENVKSEG